ncbi:MAG: class I SAM-dependent methyltransferase [Labilithrix sp.]|nr:class I SAM-dependent methyltransferase [Labilithrix sp.]MCW5811245.1 class I SAM-dependent methyltransferase [Labilithrix sp.]
MWSVRRIVRTVDRSVKRHGVVGSLVHVATSVAERVRSRGHHRDDGHDGAANTDAVEDEDFDTKYGVSTGGEIPQTELDVKDENWIHGSAYVPTSPVDFAEVLGDLGLDYEETSFVDLGSGKGRVLLMAAGLPWKRVVGVEFSPQLSEICRDNLRRFTGPKRCADLSVETTDATKYPLPAGPLVVFMYHPFDEKVMAPVADNVVASLRADPRRVLVVYFKPVHRDVWDENPAFSLRKETPLYAIYESKAR